MRSATTILLSVLLMSLSACGSLPPNANTSFYSYAPTRIATISAEERQLQQKLQAQLEAWRGVPYRLGGMDQYGVDCSGFVYQTYRELWAIELPRTTAQQAQQGVKVSVRDLNVGDLIFFQTSSRSRHVGIYSGQGRFIHASSSEGVTESRLNSPYWSRRYWKAKRVLGD